MYIADKKRYDTMVYNRCGKSGLKLPVVSLGLWHNFGDTSIYENMKQILTCSYAYFVFTFTCSIAFVQVSFPQIPSAVSFTFF